MISVLTVILILLSLLILFLLLVLMLVENVINIDILRAEGRLAASFVVYALVLAALEVGRTSHILAA